MAESLGEPRVAARDHRADDGVPRLMRKQPAVRVVAVGQLQPHRALALEGPRPVLQHASGTLVLFGASGFRCLTDLVLVE